MSYGRFVQKTTLRLMVILPYYARMTISFGNRYSIHLSYERVFEKAQSLQSKPMVILSHPARMTIASESNITLSK